MIDHEKLYGLLPNYIPDYCLQPNNDESASHHWHSLIVQAYQKVRVVKNWNKMWSCIKVLKNVRININSIYVFSRVIM